MQQEPQATVLSTLFEKFSSAASMKDILASHREFCDKIELRPSIITKFYPRLKSKLQSWKAKEVWKILDTRAAQMVYDGGSACNGTKVLIVGSGPCGLRTAIEVKFSHICVLL